MLEEVARAFPIWGEFAGGAAHGNGHINDTFAITFDQAGTPVRYVLQRINARIFRDVPALMDNIARVTRHVSAATSGPDASRRALRLLPARDGQPWHRDGEGAWWRCYLFIENARTYDITETPQQARAAAAAFGAFQARLVDLPGGRLHETIPDFHHTRKRFDRLVAAFAESTPERRAAVAAEMEFARAREGMVDRLIEGLAAGHLPERITHNDTKLNNVMIDEATQEGVCVIDLDTVMPGLALYDFGDLVRSATNTAAEDESDLSRVDVRVPIFEALVDGYRETAAGFLNEHEVAELAFSGRLMTFEVGLRFLTDYLQGDVYFKIRRAGHNRDRARNQFALVRRMEERQAEMDAIVRRGFER